MTPDLQIPDLPSMHGLLLFPFIAPPNGGKGTQTRKLSNYFQIPKIDMGAMLRYIAQQDTPLGQAIHARQANGQLVETRIVIQVLADSLQKILADNPDVKGCILDGFPRNGEQAEGLMLLCDKLQACIGKVFYLKVPDDVILQRAVNRRICPTGGEIYNLLTKPPKRPGLCDFDGSPLVQREDDRPEKVKNRIASFEEETRPIIAQFRQAGTLVKLDGNRPEDDVTQAVIREMQPFFQTEASP